MQWLAVCEVSGERVSGAKFPDLWEFTENFGILVLISGKLVGMSHSITDAYGAISLKLGTGNFFRGIREISDISGNLLIESGKGIFGHLQSGPDPVQQACQPDAFETCIAKVLILELRPDDVVIMDNLSSHKGLAVRAMIEAAGAELRYLPP